MLRKQQSTHTVRSNKRKYACVSVIILIILLVLCSCVKRGRKDGAGAGNSNPVRSREEQIIIWTWDETFNVKAANLAAEIYGKVFPELEIVVVEKEREEILADVTNMLSANLYNNLPDIIMIEDYDVQEVLSQYADEFVDLTDEISGDRFVDYKRELCSRDGRMYGIPFDSGTAALFYRVDILEQAGYTEADMQNLTWERYMEIGRDVYDKTGIYMLTLDPTDFPLVRLIMQSNGRWYVKSDGCTADIADNEALRQALQIYEQLLQDNIGVSVNGWNEFISAFQTGKVATVLSGGWIISSIKANEDQAGLWRIAPIPIVGENKDATAASNVGGSAWYVLQHSGNSGEAAKFAVTMFGENDAFVDSLIREIGLLPTVRDSRVYSSYEAQDAYFGGQQVTKLLTGMAAQIPTVNYGSKTYEIEEILEEEFQNALSDSDLEGCLKRVQIKAEAVVRE